MPTVLTPVPERTPSPNDPEDIRTNTSIELSRRKVLCGTVGAGALVLGMGTVSADGRGGQAIVATEDFRSKPFVIERITGPDEPDRKGYQCREPGREISLVGWKFGYEDDDTDRTLYTRDNQIKTDVTYRWAGRNKDCDETDGYVQIGYVVSDS